MLHNLLAYSPNSHPDDVIYELANAIVIKANFEINNSTLMPSFDKAFEFGGLSFTIKFPLLDCDIAQ